MLQELLFALVGYTGDLIIDQREHQNSLSLNLFPETPIADHQSFKLAPDINFLDPSDRDLIERIASLGFYYRELDRFATGSRNLSWIRSAKPKHNFPQSAKGSLKPSLYRRAIANGIVEVLAVYRSTILDIERKFINEDTPVLASVTEGLNKFVVLLPPLYDLVVEIEKDDIRGGQLLSFLHKRCRCGIPELQVAIQRLLWHGHQVMYSQLVAWMVYGILQDQHGEFFIRRKEGTNSNPSQLSSAISRLSTSDLSLADWQSGFHLYLDMLPDYIQIRTAESILFAGKAIRVLRNPSHNFQMNQKISRSSLKFQGFDTLFPFPKECLLDTNLVAEDLLPQQESATIETLLRDLKESPEYHKRSFECAVDAVQTIAASHLWQLVVVRADLNGHLRALKDYFLLAKGDFFQCFLEESRQLMRSPPQLKTLTSDLMVPFQLAAMKTISEEDKYFHRVSLRMPSFGEASAESSVDGWDNIALEYSVDWPLHLFVSQEVLSKYLKVFQYLLRLKRTQMELEKSWASVMHQEHSDFVEHRQRRRRWRPMWHVREHMAFLIKNLQFYIQVDVIESQWNILQSHIEDSRDFTELVKHHQQYLSALISQSFLDFGSVARILDSLMKLCLKFCWRLENHSASSSPVPLQGVAEVAEEFYKKSNSLYTILRSSRVEGSQRAPSLRRFLLRLNFNSFFEATARGVLNIVGPVASPVPNR